MNKPYVKLDKNNAAVLLVDHQAGLSSLVRDIDPDKFRNNVLALADLARYFKLPTILTTSFENGPNGPLMSELKETFPDAPCIARPGQINAWDNEDFVRAVKATGRKQLIIAGIVTEVCVAFPALSALEEGYEVFIVTDASGTFDEITRHSAWDRMSSAGAQLMTWFGVACELHRDWRNDIEGLGTGLSGITVLTGGTVHVEKCTINKFTISGINFVPTVANSQLHVVDTIVRGNGNFAASTGQGIFVAPTGAAKASLNNVRLFNNVAGLKTQGSSVTSVSDSVAAGNAFAGFSSAAAAAVVNIERSVSASNGTGVVCAGTVRIGNTSIAGNVAATSGACSSYKNNDIDVVVALTPINPQ